MRPQDLIRVLVIDDSAFSRKTITRLLQSSPLVEVVGVARDGEEALRKTFELSPDLVTLDLEMPRMDGFTYLRLVMARQPTPVMVISSRSANSEVFKALELGAVDFIAKPTPRAGPELETIEQELIRKVHSIRELRIDKVRERLATPPLRAPTHAAELPATTRVVVVASSTGGPAALMQIFSAFQEVPPCAFLVAQHMPEGFTQGFAERVDRFTVLRAAEARGGEPVEAGRVWVAPGGSHLTVESEAGSICTCLLPRSASDKYAPSADRLFASAAKHYGSQLLAVVLTGMGDDGRLGALAVKEAGGSVLAESEETAVIFGMPRQAIRSGSVDRVLPLPEIAAAIRGVGGASAGRASGRSSRKGSA